MGTFIMHQRVEHLKISLEVLIVSIINIKADDIFIGKISTDAIWSKVDYLISNISPKAPTKFRPLGDATFSTILWF